MKNLINPTTISIGFELAKDIWQLLHDAKHPHHESKIIENIKNQLATSIQNSIKSIQQPETKEDNK